MKTEKTEPEVESLNTPIDQIHDKDVIIMKGNTKTINKESCLDSMEEYYFAHYLKELIEAGVVLDADKNETPIVLAEPSKHTYTEFMKTKQKMGFRHLLNGHHYTPDFNVQWNPEWKDIIYASINRGKQFTGQKIPFITFSAMYDGSIFEVKGGFMTSDNTYHTGMNIKWLFEMRQMFVQKVKIPKLFEETFTPQVYIDDNIYQIKSKKGQSKLKYKPKTCKEYLSSIKEAAEGQTSML